MFRGYDRSILENDFKTVFDDGFGYSQETKKMPNSLFEHKGKTECHKTLNIRKKLKNNKKA